MIILCFWNEGISFRAIFFFYGVWKREGGGWLVKIPIFHSTIAIEAATNAKQHGTYQTTENGKKKKKKEKRF